MKIDLTVEKNNKGERLVTGGTLLFKWNGEIVRGTILEVRPGKLRVTNDANIQCWVKRNTVLGWSAELKKPFEWYFYKVMCETGWILRNIINSHRMYDYWLDKIIFNTDYNLYGEFSLRRKK